jgi:hypothetical protein
MKQFLSLALALVLTTGLAFAQGSTATVTQTGDNAEATITQTGAGHTARIEQDATASAADPSQVGTITQTGGSGNDAVLEQAGKGQRAYITQTGSDNNASLKQQNPGTNDPNTSWSYIVQTGDRNTAEAELYRHNGYVRQTQAGDDNQAYVKQDVPSGGVQGYRSADQVQTGDRNYAMADMTGESLTNTLNQYQAGDDNRTEVLHFGYGATADIDQVGDRNTALFEGSDASDVDLFQEQVGDDNASYIRAFSSHNYGSGYAALATRVETEQFGDRNLVDADANDTYDNLLDVLQSGNDNEVWVTFTAGAQAGGTAYHDAPTWDAQRNTVAVSQTGDLNQAFVTVGSQGNQAHITQTGDGNTATVSQ